ncbi:MAG: hypothetical protein E4H10_14450 [Bacteroidia bacterium]|nr:MAG: hypothetical protein E4H10_14450 [Bacteroidia bacterium]
MQVTAQENLPIWSSRNTPMFGPLSIRTWTSFPSYKSCISLDYRYLVIEGNIGAGKTSLASKLAAETGSRLILEEFSDNPFLAKF